MKFTNVKQLIIKFMGGGLINFPTRFLRWVKINGDVEGDDGGGDSGGGGDSEGSNIFLSPLVIQPSYYNEASDGDIIHEIQNIANTISSNFEEREILPFYSKEQVVNLGIDENILNSLQQVTVTELFEDIYSSGNKGYKNSDNLNSIINNNYLVVSVLINSGAIMCRKTTIEEGTEGIIYKLGDDIYFISAFYSIG